MADGRRRIAIVTGANGAIGAAICAGMATRGFEVVMVGRSAERVRQAGERLAKQIGGAAWRSEIVDLSRKGEIIAFAERWQGPLDVLVNNAAVAPRRRSETPEGIETELATNVLGYVWMMCAFEPALRRGAPARVVNVASYWAGDLDLDDLQFRARRYDNDTAYRQSKQADRMLTAAFAGRWPPAEITVNCCHPGDANSTLSNSLGYGGHESPEEAADTPVWLATDASLAGTTGRYFARRRAERCAFAADGEAVTRLFDLCMRY